MPDDITPGDAEIRHLRSSINSLISLQTLPAIWDGRDRDSIVSTLLDVLVSMLRLDFAYVQLKDSSNASPAEFLRLGQRTAPLPQASEIGRALDRWLSTESIGAPRAVPNPAGEGEVRIAPFRLGLTDEIGVLVAGSKRPAFPTPTETLLLRMAANQALVALQEARQLREQKRGAQELERRVADRTTELTAANEALRESEKKYRTLFNSIDEGFCTVAVLFDEKDHPVDYRFLEVNPSFEKQTGIQNAQGRRMREIAPHHEEHWFEIYGRIALTGEPVRFESQAAQLRRWFDVYAFRIGEPQDRKVAILFNDITQRKQAEAKLLLNEAYLSEAQKLSHTGSWARSLANSEITYWSEECYRVLGFDPRDGLPKFEQFLQRVHPDDRARVGKATETAARAKAEYEVDYQIVLPGGHIRDIHVVGHPVFGPSGDLVEYVGTVIDVTERKRAQVLLAGENRLLEMITRGEARELILKALCRLVEELSQGSLSSILLLDPKANQLRHGAAPSLPAAYVEAIDGSVIGPCAGSCGTAAYRAEPVIVSDIATDPLWADYRDLALAHGLRACWSTPILSSAGKVLGAFASYYREQRHPTALEHAVVERIVQLASIAVEREQSEEALRKAQAELAHVSRVTIMGELAASIAHEVNQPLTAVVNNANASITLLPKNTPNLAEVRQALTEIIEDANRASDVIARVRQLAKRAPVEKSVLDLGDVVRDVLALARYESAARHVTISLDLSRDLPSVFGDRVQLQQVLLNLVMNGMDAMNQVDETKRVLLIRGRAETQNGSPEVSISVQDAGAGLKPPEMDRIFEAFYTTKTQGMGMGLAISRSIIEAHGGRLWAELNQGPGATFLFSLPVAGDDPS